MEFNTAYDINIISQINEVRGLFVVVEQFNSGSTGYFQNYYKRLLDFNDCSEWFEKFDYPIIETGKVSSYLILTASSYITVKSLNSKHSKKFCPLFRR
jgi:hypothetical protein